MYDPILLNPMGTRADGTLIDSDNNVNYFIMSLGASVAFQHEADLPCFISWASAGSISHHAGLP